MTLRPVLESKALNHFEKEHNLGKEAICGCNIQPWQRFLSVLAYYLPVSLTRSTAQIAGNKAQHFFIYSLTILYLR